MASERSSVGILSAGTSVRRVDFLQPVGTPREVVAALAAWLAAPDEPAPLVVETSGSTGAPKRVLLSRRAVLASVDASARRLGGTGPWLLALPPSYVAGVQVVCRSLVAGHEPLLLEEPARSPAASTPARASSRWCRPSCTGCSTTPAEVAALAALPHRAARRRPDRPGAARPGGGGRRARGGDVRLGGDRRRLRLRRLPARRRRAGDRRRRPDPDRRADPVRRVRRRPGADRRGAGRRLVPHLRRRSARRRRPAARARPARRRRGQRRRERARPGGRRPAARAPGRRAGRGGRRTGRGVGQPAGRLRRRRPRPRRGAGLGGRGASRGRGRRGRWSCSTRCRCSTTARSTGCGCEELA